MTALILHSDPDTARSLEQDYLAAGAMVFSSGNSPGTQHYEVSNPHHHSALVYQNYNTAIFGEAYAQKLAAQAVAALVIDSDVVVCPEDSTGIFLIGRSIAKAAGIPVVGSVAEVFGVEVPTSEKKESIAEKYVTLDGERYFLTREEAGLDSLSDGSISILEKEGIPYFDSYAKYLPDQPAIKRGAIVFPGGMV